MPALSGHAWVRERDRGQDFVEANRVHQFAFQHERPDRLAGLDRLFRNFRSLLVAEVRAQRGGQGCAAIEEFPAPVRIGRDPFDAARSRPSPAS